MKIETLAVHGGHTIDPATGAVAPPIHLSTTFEREIDGGVVVGEDAGNLDCDTRRRVFRGTAAQQGFPRNDGLTHDPKIDLVAGGD